MSTAWADVLSAARPSRWSKARLGLTLDAWQQEVLETLSRYVIMVCGRQVGKSTVVAVKVVHRALTTHNALVLLIAPSLRQSIELMRKVKGMARAAGEQLVTDNKTEIELRNGSRIVALPGSEDTVRGFAAVDLIVVDEAAFASDDLYYAVEPMIQISRGDMVLLSSAYITNGFFYEIWHSTDPTWERYRVTAYDCPRYDRDELERLKRTIPPRKFECEYLAEFIDPEGAVFTAEQIAAMFDEDVEPIGEADEHQILDDDVEALG